MGLGMLMDGVAAASVTMAANESPRALTLCEHP
jgi:hypothetical protein